MQIALGSDHRGLGIRDTIITILEEDSHGISVFGPENQESIDYPDIAAKVASKVSSGEFDYGILICGSGIGMCIVANKFPGIRAAACHNEVTTELSRRHNNANILCLSGELLGEETCRSILKKWFGTEFEGGRHQVRIDRINALESIPIKERV